MNETKSYEPVSSIKFQPDSAKDENKKPKSRYRKYAGAKTSYGEIGGSSYVNPGVSGRSTDIGRYRSPYGDSGSRADHYQPSK